MGAYGITMANHYGSGGMTTAPNTPVARAVTQQRRGVRQHVGHAAGSMVIEKQELLCCRRNYYGSVIIDQILWFRRNY